MEKMYMIRGLNSLYFVWSALPLKAIESKTRAGETAEECDPSAAFSIRYGGQPLYGWAERIDRRSGLPFISEWVIDKKDFIIEHGITTERRYFY